MKKFLSLLLTACLAASLLAGCGVKIEDAGTTNTPKAEPTAAAATKAPEPTTAPTEPAATATPTMTPTPTPDPDVVYGFKLIETKNFPLIQSDVSLYEHQKTGAKFVYIANEDTNRAFQLTFNTRPIDDTGLPHVFEHSCLCGSEKYPYDQLWWAVSYQTYNTYVNAYTTDAMTCYPVGSLSEAQLLKLAEYYTDACYHPLILENEKIYRTEAWRYRLEKPEDEMTIEGTVYSEMQGSFTLNRFASQMAYKTAFPGSVLGFDYGGNPDHIPEMTWENLKNYHSLYYHPSNSVAFLYGKFEDFTAFMKILDGYYADYDKSEFKFEDTNYARLTGPVSAEYGYPMPAETDVNNTSVVEYYLIVPGLRDDIEQEHVVDNMCSLLGSTSSVLGQAMKRAFPSASFGIGRELAAEDDGICITVNNVNKGDAELIKK
ncbi:MAG: insulinase family protein, partial [Lachnospiraceae bacterium]|nr:insulinase family protein [Lachnospiraceae bacterium]